MTGRCWVVSWDTASDIAAIQAPTGFQKNSTPALTERQAMALLEAIPTDTLQGLRDLALISAYFITGCRASAIINTCVGHLETDGVEHYLNVTEKRHKRRRKIRLDAAHGTRDARPGRLVMINRAGWAGTSSPA